MASWSKNYEIPTVPHASQCLGVRNNAFVLISTQGCLINYHNERDDALKILSLLLYLSYFYGILINEQRLIIKSNKPRGLFEAKAD